MMGAGRSMNKKELIVQRMTRELETLAEEDLVRMLAYLHILKETRDESLVFEQASESVLAREWLTPEEDEAWAHL